MSGKDREVWPTFPWAPTCVKLSPHTQPSVSWMPCHWLHPLILHHAITRGPIITELLLLQFSGGTVVHIVGTQEARET